MKIPSNVIQFKPKAPEVPEKPEQNDIDYTPIILGFMLGFCTAGLIFSLLRMI